jgi:FKBP-type peptidyl-prolyl cis-trans isomerase FklB
MALMVQSQMATPIINEIGTDEQKREFLEPALKGEKERLGYSLGMDVGSTLKRQSVEVDPDTMARGFKDAYTGGKTLLTEEEARKEIQAFQTKLMEKQAEAMKQLSEKNRMEGEKFLAENAKKEGVKTLPSGLQYKVILPGSGKTPKATDSVTTHYRGTLVDGTEFDSSYKRGEPATFPVSGVIAGWTEALQLMKEGAKWQLVLPPSLAYGERGVGRDIGPNATLIFEVELIKVQ